MVAALKNLRFAGLCSAGLVSSLGDWVLFIALPFYVYVRTGSALVTGGMFAAETLPRMVVAPAAGVLADRWNRRNALIACDVSRSALVLLVLASQPRGLIWIVFVAAAGESAISQLFNTARSAIIPVLVSEAELVPANSLDALAGSVTQLAGAPLGGVLFATGGVQAVVVGDCASYVLSAAIIAFSVPALSGTVSAAEDDSRSEYGGFVHDFREGVRVIRASSLLCLLVVVMAVFMLGQGFTNVLLVPLVRSTLHGTAGLFGLLAAVQGVGSVVGAPAAAALRRLVRPVYFVPIGLCCAGSLLALLAAFPAVPVAVGSIALAGLVFPGVFIGSQTVSQLAVPNRLRGRVSGTRIAINAGANTIGMLGGGTLIQAVGARGGLLIAAGLWLSGGLVGMRLGRLEAVTRLKRDVRGVRRKD